MKSGTTTTMKIESPLAASTSRASSPRLTKRTSWQQLTCPLALAILLGTGVTAALPAQAQTFTVLHRFRGKSDGAGPSGLIRDSAGNLYGTTSGGGAFGLGTVFKLNAAGKETVMHSFGGVDGTQPLAGLIRDSAGNFYGTTSGGGVFGLGTVFKLNAAGRETVMHSFGGADGAQPLAGLIRDSEGNLYGTTWAGGALWAAGAFGLGTVFKLDASGTETVLHSFAGADGEYPYGSLTRDSEGNLYGTTLRGGTSGRGAVFKLDTSGTETVLHSFAGADGFYPTAGLVLDAAGNLYGTAYHGGKSGCVRYGCGTVFKLDSSGKMTVLHAFFWWDGALPDAVLVLDAKGNLYGTTFEGGTSGHGTVFKVDRKGKETVLWSFNGTTNGNYPKAGLVWDANGNLYGTTSEGGGTSFVGTVFKVTP